MLAQNFKTPAELGLSGHEFEALAKVLGMLEREEMKHVAYIGQDIPVCCRQFSGQFSMVTYGSRNDCGTVACIAGTSDMLFGTDFMRHNLPSQLDELFIPTHGRLSSITPAQASIALRNYLTHGEARWDEAMSA